MKNLTVFALLVLIFTSQVQAAVPITTIGALETFPVNTTKVISVKPTVPSVIPPIVLGTITAVASGLSFCFMLAAKRYYLNKTSPAKNKFIFAVMLTTLSLVTAIVSGCYTNKKRIVRNKAKKELAQTSTVPAVVA